MNFPHFNRRLHLYLSLGLLPWVLMYGISSYFFAHPELGRAWYGERMRWTQRAFIAGVPNPERHIPAAGAPPEEMREFAKGVLASAGLRDLADSASFGAYRTGPKQINVYVYRFLGSTQIRFNTDTQNAVVEESTFRWDHFFTGMHSRGGFEQDGFWQYAWAVVVDVASLGFLLWVATGLYMWWTLGARTARAWGWVALLGGVISFVVFLMKL